ncbi:hypothetical protein J7443_06020 [Tropicibacter sp. R15_0]|uniref:tetratricopeptide repeat protein n=1 Tax=Tropicibacter sp. R15_0 TaxID=2821101 RepID=UPI001ADA259D|nr:hypothetical protein [Tropicibacter sp. R15_0]MBO9464777.1 hypothetical protein [Tropicibacter sp. R15_0]
MKDALTSFLRDSGLEAQSNAARLLGYVVTEVVEGRAQGIKALTIAQDIFGRGASFDPSKDSLVRVEMKRLRDILDHHYATTGAEAQVCIRIPKGTYVPVFERRAVAVALAGDEATGGVAHSRRRVAWGVGLTLLGIGLVAVGWLVLAEPPDPGEGEPKVRVASVSGAVRNAEKVALETLSRFRNFAVLEPGQTGTYALTFDGSSAVVKAQFVHEASGEVIVSANFGAQEIGALSDADELSPFRIWLGKTFARNGVMEADYKRRGEAGGDMACSKLTEAYFSNQTDAAHLEARDCIMNRLDQGHNSARLKVDLALLTREEHSDQRNLLPGNALDRASQAARDAVSLDRFDATAHYTLMTVLFATGAVQEGIAAGQRSIEINPFDGEALGGFAARLNYIGEHDQALALFDRSSMFIPGGLKWRDFGYFLAYLGKDDMARAAEAGLALRGLTNNSLYVVALAISHAHRGDAALAREMKALLLEQEPDIRDMFERRAYAPELVEKLMHHLDAI